MTAPGMCCEEFNHYFWAPQSQTRSFSASFFYWTCNQIWLLLFFERGTVFHIHWFFFVCQNLMTLFNIFHRFVYPWVTIAVSLWTLYSFRTYRFQPFLNPDLAHWIRMWIGWREKLAFVQLLAHVAMTAIRYKWISCTFRPMCVVSFLSFWHAFGSFCFVTIGPNLFRDSFVGERNIASHLWKCNTMILIHVCCQLGYILSILPVYHGVVLPFVRNCTLSDHPIVGAALEHHVHEFSLKYSHVPRSFLAGETLVAVLWIAVLIARLTHPKCCVWATVPPTGTTSHRPVHHHTHTHTHTPTFFLFET